MIEAPNPASEADVINLEKSIGLSFPQEYRDFLFAYNMAEWVSLYYADTMGVAREVQSFFSVGDPIKSCDILHNFNTDTKAGNNIENHLPIACSSSGDLISLSLDRDDYGTVWLRDDMLSFGNRGNMNAYSNIASSFTEFLENLSDQIPE